MSFLVKDIKIYLDTLEEFSASFVEDNNGSIQEGFFYKNKNRIRIDYVSPTKIKIILDKNKAMYLNYDLKEIEYFNPNKTPAKIVFDIFYTDFINSYYKYEAEENFSKLFFEIKDEELIYFAEIIFETRPLHLRLVNIIGNDQNISFGLKDHNFNTSFEKNFFSMADPFIK